MTRHLTEAQLVDAAEGAVSQPHLDACAACHQQVAALRDVMSAAVADAVPDPSPLFWDHFSARVRDAVTADESERPSSWHVPTARVRWFWLAGLTVLLAASSLFFSPHAPSSVEAPAPAAVINDTEGDAALADDPSLSLVADLAADLDWDAGAAVLGPLTGASDQVAGRMTDGERRELQRLLRSELAPSSRGAEQG